MTLVEIEALLPTLSREELAHLEAVLSQLCRESDADVRLDARPWPSRPQEIAALIAELDALPPLLAPDEADRFDAWREAERERQRLSFHNRGDRARQLFT